jgi:hypothetical protein
VRKASDLLDTIDLLRFGEPVDLLEVELEVIWLHEWSYA